MFAFSTWQMLDIKSLDYISLSTINMQPFPLLQKGPIEDYMLPLVSLVFRSFQSRTVLQSFFYLSNIDTFENKMHFQSTSLGLPVNNCVVLES